MSNTNCQRALLIVVIHEPMVMEPPTSCVCISQKRDWKMKHGLFVFLFFLTYPEMKCVTFSYPQLGRASCMVLSNHKRLRYAGFCVPRAKKRTDGKP